MYHITDSGQTSGANILDGSRRLYDRHSAPADEKYSQLLSGGEARTADATATVGSGLSRPKTPVDDAIASANWSVGSTGNPPGLVGVTPVQPRYPMVNNSISERTSSLLTGGK
jgi:hypothetical protein